jgi:hypothetical protein
VMLTRSCGSKPDEVAHIVISKGDGMNKNWLIVSFLLIGFSGIAHAEAYLCVEEQSTGFRFESANKTWHPTNFQPNDKFTVKRNTTAGKTKWVVLEAGHSLPIFSCDEDFTSAGAMRCESKYGEFNMNKSQLRFLSTYTWGYWNETVPGEKGGAEGRDTPRIGIGKCSIMELE